MVCQHAYVSCLPREKDILCGGLIIGTVTMIEEDVNTRHSSALCKYLLAEGAACGHALMIVSADSNPRDLLRTLPAVISEEEHRSIMQSEQPDVCPGSIYCVNPTLSLYRRMILHV